MGGTPVTLVSGQQDPWAIAVDATSLYWVDSGNGTVLKMPKAGGAVTTLASGQSAPLAIAVDGTSVYWSNIECPDDGGMCDDGNVMSVPLAGGSANTGLGANWRVRDRHSDPVLDEPGFTVLHRRELRISTTP
jgi:hypothetical protein